MKGQFFILGAILIISLFFMGLPNQGTFIVGKFEDIDYLFENVHREFPIALNNILNMSEDLNEAPDRLMNFTRYVDSRASEKLINFSTFWVISWNSSPSNINVTAGNYLRYNTTVTLNVSGSVFYLIPKRITYTNHSN